MNNTKVMMIVEEVISQVETHGRIWPQDRPISYVEDFLTNLDVDTSNMNEFDKMLKFKNIIFKFEKITKDIKKAGEELNIDLDYVGSLL
jgi:hypothetical protein